MNAFIDWTRATSLSEWVRMAPTTWPALETVHFVGMCLMLGVIGLLDMRLLGGLPPSIPLVALRRLMPWGLFGFALSMTSGVLFFIGAPDQYLRNPAFYMKLLFLVIAGLNAAYFETHAGGQAIEEGRAREASRAFKVAGAVSLFSWAMVLFWGRMLPFIGNAF